MKISLTTLTIIVSLSTIFEHANAVQPKLRGALQQEDSRYRDTDTKKKILVIGAGMAGLTAARSLLGAGHEVEILEYQDRIGGRLWSHKLKHGGVTELGGGHFRSNMPNVLKYISHYNIQLNPMNDGLPIYANNKDDELFFGQASDLTSLQQWGLHYNETNVTPTSLLNYYLHLNGLDTSRVLEEDYPNQKEIAKFDGMTFADMIRKSGGSPGLLQLLEDHNGGLLNAAVLSLMTDLAYHMGDENLFRIRGGNEILPQAMAIDIEELAGDDVIHMNQNVVDIDHSNSKIVKVAAIDRETGEEIVYEADEVISTVSFQLFKNDDITVYPNFSEAKRRMFEEFDWGNSMKVVCQTDSPTWLSENAHGWPMAGSSDRIWERVIDITGASRHGNIFFYLNGKNAEKVADMFPQGSADYVNMRADYVIGEFNKDMPGLVGKCIDKTSIYWNEVAWMKGSYGQPPLDGCSWMIEEWTRPEGGRIWLAGDFTSMKTGWVEGAIESGMRVARGIDPNAVMVYEE